MSHNFVSFEGALDALRDGGVCALPTDTVYGLAGDISNGDAIREIYRLKQRPAAKPLIALCADISMVEELVEFSPLATHLAKLWPGPLTLVLPLKPDAKVSELASAGQSDLGVRVLDHALTQKLIEAVGRPLGAPSANPSNQAPATSAAQVRAYFGDKVPILDGGPSAIGTASTIVRVVNGELEILRAGAKSRAEITAHLKTI